jgi:hypothetical protein
LSDDRDLDRELYQTLNEPPIRLTFGEVEARLARLHEISSEKRTQFQARLRNFQKHGIPAGGGSGRGRVVHYGPGNVMELALALELTQLGLLPERIAQVFLLNKFPISQAVLMAARSILTKGGFKPDRDRIDENMPTNTGSHWHTHDEAEDPDSIFLFFDPTALASLTDIPEKYEDQASATFFYGGAEIVRENIVRWTAGPVVRRLSLINVTAVIWSLVVRTTPERQRQFCEQIHAWADVLQTQHLMETIPDEEPDPENIVIIDSDQALIENAELFRSLKGIPTAVADTLIDMAKQRIKTGGGRPRATEQSKPISEMSDTEVEEALVDHFVSGGMPHFVARGVMEDRRKRSDKNVEQAKPKSRKRD